MTTIGPHTVDDVFRVFEREYDGQRNTFRDVWCGRDGPQDPSRFYPNNHETRRYQFAAEVVRLHGPQSRVLECGCNIAEFPRRLVEDGLVLPTHVWGIDIDRAYIEFARWYVPGGTFIVTAIEYMQEFLSGLFDVVIASEVLEHVADLDRCMTSIAAATKAGGHVVMSTPDGDASEWAKNYLLAHPDKHRLVLNEADLTTACARVGLTVVGIERTPIRWDGLSMLMMAAEKRV